MVTRERRLAEFDGLGAPPRELPVEVLCEDHSGTYRLPFPCHWSEDGWRNATSGDTVTATVIAWRKLRS